MNRESYSRRNFLEALFGDFFENRRGYVVVKTVRPPDCSIHTFYFPDIDLLATEEFADDAEVSVGVCPIFMPGSTKERTRYLTTFWANMDVGRAGHEHKSIFLGTRAEAVDAIRRFPCAPSVIVESGYGVHLYWLLKEPVLVTDPQEVGHIIRAIGSLLQCDTDGSPDAHLRLPGTWNLKFADRPVRCEATFINAGFRYSQQDFIDMCGMGIPRDNNLFWRTNQVAPSFLDTVSLPAPRETRAQDEIPPLAGAAAEPDDWATAIEGRSDDIAMRTQSRRSDETTLTLPAKALAKVGFDTQGWKIGDIIDGKYEVKGIIGRGGMGVVYRVHHRDWHLDLAVKVPLAESITDETSKARFIREAQTWVDLGLHPNIVQCWYVRELDGLPRIFMDYIDGGNLKDWLKRGTIKPGQWEMIIDLAIQACHGLQYAHERGLVHRDVKPSNMLMTGDGRLVMTDFGIVKIEGFLDIQSAPFSQGFTGRETLTRTGSTMGTPEYAAPEMWLDARLVDQRADIYSLGVILFELSCGRRPFDDGTHSEPPHVLIERHLSAPAPDPCTHNERIPPALADLTRRCMAKDPKDRPESVAVISEKLANLYQAVTGREYQRPAPGGTQLRAGALNNKGVSLWELGDHERAYQAWDEALRMDAHHAEALYNRSLMQWRDAAITDLEVARRLSEASKASPYAKLYLGYIQLERLAAHSAEREIESALQHPQVRREASAWRALGESRTIQGKRESADEAYQQGLSVGYADEGPPGTSAGSRTGSTQSDQRSISSWLRCVRTFALRRDAGYALCVAVTPDGQFVLSGSLGGTIRMWRFSSGGYLRAFKGHEGAVYALAVTSDGRYFVSGGVDHTVRVWHLSTGECVRTLGRLSPALSRLRFRNFLSSGEYMRTLGAGRRDPRAHSQSVQSVSTNPSGSSVASASWDGTVCLWDIETGRCLRTYEGHEGPVNAVCITSDGKYVVSAGWDKTLRVWDLNTGECLRTFTAGGDVTNALAVSPDGEFIVAGTAENVIRVWGRATGTSDRQLVGHSALVHAVAITPDGAHVVSGSQDRTVRVWELATGRCLRTLEGHRRPVECLCITPDGQYALSGGQESALRLWSISLVGESSRGSLQINRLAGYTSVHDSADRFGKHLDAALDAFQAGDCETSYRHLNEARSLDGYERDPEALSLHAKLTGSLPALTLKAGWQARSIGAPEPILSLAVSADGTSIITGHPEGMIEWDFSTGKTRKTFEGHAAEVSAVALVQEGRRVVSASWDRTVRLWDLTGGDCLFTMTGHSDVIPALSPTADGKFAVSGGWDSTLRLWDLATGKCLRAFGEETGWIEAVCVVPGDLFAVSGGWDNTLRVWNLATGECMTTFPEQTSRIGAVRVTPDGRFAVTGTGDGGLDLWDLGEGICLRTLGSHRGFVGALSLTPDGRFAASGSSDSTVRVWDLATGECLWIFEGHSDVVGAVAVTPDACFLASGSADGTIRLWRLDWDLNLEGSVKPLTECYRIDCTRSLAQIYGVDHAEALSEVYRPSH